mmetsp:Transcript_24768/g.80098  ORF Transcript_24768/g.80098 Transcript_24768/m.80098 type:complete len:159 (+) Transcript_24768:440-916(+)
MESAPQQPLVKVYTRKLVDLRNVKPHLRPRMGKVTLAELQQLVALGVFTIVDIRRMAGATPMTSKFVYRAKVNADGTFDKDKARPVVKGFQGVLGHDFFGTFAPMASMMALRVLVALSVSLNLLIYQADLPNACCHSRINALILLQLPEVIVFENDEG